MSMSDMIAAPIEADIGELKGVLLRRLNDQDIAAIDEWLKARYIRIARLSVVDEEDDDEKMLVIQAAIDRAMQISWMVPPGSAMLANPLGLARLLWQACTQEKYTLEDFHRQMFTPGVAESATGYLKQIAPRVPGPEPKSGTGEKKPGASETT